MKVENMTSKNGNKIANQFIITDKGENGCTKTEIFQSYDSEIAIIEHQPDGSIVVYLDEQTWNYSRTTSKYRNQFLGETTKETLAKIKSGEYILTNLN